LLAKAKERSPESLSLYTFQKNIPARTFYEKHGFKVIKFGISPDEEEPDAYYEWKKPNL
jgi:ribosomal protein S18 acetylase RimI-like enzyme